MQTFVAKIYAFKNYLLVGALVATALQIPLAHLKPTLPKIKSSKTEATENSTPLTTAFFGEETPENVANAMVKANEKFISTRPAYSASLKVIQKHEDTIRQTAEKYGVPANLAIGVGLLENGGSETAKSVSGALGIFQLMPGTARNLGLIVNKKTDQRKDPVKNIDAGMRYLKANYLRFGDWGLATWAYHAGEGNVAKAVQLYFKEEYNVQLAGLKNILQMKEQIEQTNTTIHNVLSSPAVKEFTKKLNDDSAGYPYKVLATAELFE